MTSTRAVKVAAATALACLLSALPAQGQVARTIDEMAKKTGMEAETLERAGAKDLLNKDVTVRRKWFVGVVTEEFARADLLPVMVLLAEHENDWPLRLSAVKTLSIFALRADRDVVIETVIPVLERNMKADEDQLVRWSLEELRRLNRWFRCDELVAPGFEAQFRGKDFNLRGMAFRGICDLKHPRLVEKLVLPSAWKVYDSSKSGLFDRRQAVRMFARHEERKALKTLQKNLTKDGRVALVSAWALGRMADEKSLKDLRKVNFSAVHSLRFLCWFARCRLNDKTCLKEVQKVVANKNEHDEIKRIFVADLGHMTTYRKEIDKLLTAYSQHKNKAVRVGAAVARIRQGDPSGQDLVTETLLGEWPDLQNLGRKGKGWMRHLRFMDRLMRIESEAVDPVLVSLLDVRPPKDALEKTARKDNYVDWFRYGTRRSETLYTWYDEYRADAVSLIGERRIEAALPRLTEISDEEWGHLRFHSLISRIEMGDEKALYKLRWFLPKYDDAVYGSRWFVLASEKKIYTNRMRWSSIFTVCDKFERRGPAEKDLYLPLLDELLQPEKKEDDPMKKGWAARVRGGYAPGEAPEGAGPTITRGKDEPKPEEAKRSEDEPSDPVYRPPEVAYRLRNQFARRRIVQCAARLGGDEAAAVLGRALRDSRATVRSAALTEIGAITNAYTLPEGSLPEREHTVWPIAVEWLKSKGQWPD